MRRPSSSAPRSSRRQLLAVLTAGAVGAFAGCSASSSPGDESATPTETATRTPDQLRVEFAGVNDDDWADISVDETYDTEFAGDGLSDDSYVIGVTSADGTQARAYPLSVVWWHEIVNDVLDEPLLVTFCPMILAQAICGDHEGARLPILPSTVATWREWQRAQPVTDVLLPPPHSTAM